MNLFVNLQVIPISAAQKYEYTANVTTYKKKEKIRKII